jgi:hypothetical protein
MDKNWYQKVLLPGPVKTLSTNLPYLKGLGRATASKQFLHGTKYLVPRACLRYSDDADHPALYTGANFSPDTAAM